MIICFEDTQNRGIWKLFTFWRKGFGHCFAVNYDAARKVWYTMECASEKMNFSIYTEERESDLLIYHLSENCICLEVDTSKNPIYFPRWLYCVSYVKHIVGLRKFWVVTPYQLYCELRKLGAERIFDDVKGD